MSSWRLVLKRTFLEKCKFLRFVFCVISFRNHFFAWSKASIYIDGKKKPIYMYTGKYHDQCLSQQFNFSLRKYMWLRNLQLRSHICDNKKLNDAIKRNTNRINSLPVVICSLSVSPNYFQCSIMLLHKENIGWKLLHIPLDFRRLLTHLMSLLS